MFGSLREEEPESCGREEETRDGREVHPDLREREGYGSWMEGTSRDSSISRGMVKLREAIGYIGDQKNGREKLLFLLEVIVMTRGV